MVERDERRQAGVFSRDVSLFVRIVYNIGRYASVIGGVRERHEA